MHPIVLRRVMPSLPGRIWSDDDWERIRAGGTGPGAGTKWSADWAGGLLHLYRSRTGYEIYEATFLPVADGGWKISSAVIEGDPLRYTSPSVNFDCLVLELVISAVLLGEPADELRSSMTRTVRAVSGIADMPSRIAEYSVLGIP